MMDEGLFPRGPDEAALLLWMQRYGDDVLRLCAVCLGDAASARRATCRVFVQAARTCKAGTADMRAQLLRLAVGQLTKQLGPIRWRAAGRSPHDPALFDALMALSPRDRAAVVLCRDLGLPPEQAAFALHMRTHALRRRVRNLCARLGVRQNVP